MRKTSCSSGFEPRLSRSAGTTPPTSRAHERALEQIHSQATVIPIRMCTVYRTEGGVRERLRRDARSLEHALSHLRGKDEFGVKVFADLHRGIGAAGADPHNFVPGAIGAAW